MQDIDRIIKRIDNIASKDNIKAAMGNCCLQVERTAKQKVKGALANSIENKVIDEGDSIKGVVYNTLEISPYIEYGTGIFAEGGKGRQSVPWVFVKGSTKEAKSKKTYTLEEAKQTMAILRSKNLEAYYTYGRKPNPFMRPALYSNKEKILKWLGGATIK